MFQDLFGRDRVSYGGSNFLFLSNFNESTGRQIPLLNQWTYKEYLSVQEYVNSR